MSIDDSTHTHVNGEPFAERDARALTEPMLVLAESPRVARDTDDRYHVISGELDYVVDLVAKTCGCPDAIHRRPTGGCKHIRRARYATGVDAIPRWVGRDQINRQLGEHVDSRPVVRDGDRVRQL